VLAQDDGRPLDVTDYYSDHWVIRAVYVDGADQPTPLEDSVSLDVGKADSSIAVQTTATTLVADINGRLPGGVQANSFLPDDGVVHFKVDGQPVGAPAIAENGRATISHVVQPGTHTITATYDGDGRYNPATETSSRKDPLLSARVLATFPRSKAGWYRTAVEVFFVCRPQGSEVDDCPADVTLRKSGKDHSLTRTIHAADGGTATVTVGNIDIDRVKPTITVDGRSCTATDKLSGVRGTCHLHLGQDGSYRAVAIDRAGNRAVKHGVLG
jgi:hypothetical protein